MAISKRAHVVTHYRLQADGVTPNREKKTRWVEVATGVACDLQPASGSLDQEEYGQRGRRRRNGYFDAGTDIQIGDGLAVTAGTGTGTRWIVETADDWGGPGDLEARLVETGEPFVAGG